jgi:hypothetical protein
MLLRAPGFALRFRYGEYPRTPKRRLAVIVNYRLPRAIRCPLAETE